tara:strand:- start:95 stop:556 length:462 start_codon:yes stop_codon:yes gene_type:complete
MVRTHQIVNYIMEEAGQHNLLGHASFQGAGSTLLNVCARTETIPEEVNKRRLFWHRLEWPELRITSGHKYTANPAARTTPQVVVLLSEFSDGRIDTGLPTLFEHVTFKFLFHEVLERIGFLLRSHERDRGRTPNTLEKFTSIYLHITTTSDQD